MANMPVHQFMIREVVSVARGTSMARASQVMLEAGVSALVFVDGDRPCGILSQKDMSTLCMLQLTGAELPSDERIALDDFFTVAEDADSDEAWELMQQRRCRQLVAVDARGSLAGIVTQTDLLHVKVGLIEAQKQHLEQCVCDRTRELRETNERLNSLSRIDPLLGIGNRRSMDEQLLRLAESAKRYKRPYAVALIDVDHFKPYNDLYGHQDGDAALVRIARVVESTTRASDTVYRYGGEELLVLLPEVDVAGAMVATENIRRAVAEKRWKHERSPIGHVTVSAGVAGQDLAAPCTTRMIADADAALYRAKSLGRNRVELHDAHGGGDAIDTGAIAANDALGPRAARATR